VNSGIKLAIGVVVALLILQRLIGWLDPSPRCVGDEQCADLHQSERER